MEIFGEVAGGHSAIYEAYYHKVDPKGNGSIGASDAARFLKMSGLSDVVLSRVWDLSDPAGRGFLDKVGLFVALKLVALAQAGHDVNMRNIAMETPPPKVGEIPKLPPKPPSIAAIPTAAPVSIDWTIKPAEKAKYDLLFESLQPSNGMIPGNKVKGMLMDSKLPLETLGRIWDLADQDKDGMLDRHEFVVAMHLVYKALEKHAIPTSLPPELMPPAKQAPQIEGFANFANMSPTVPIATPPILAQPILPAAPIKPQQPATPSWVVPADDAARSDVLFVQCDIDRDGLVSGMEVRDVFLRSGVPQACLAHIWGLCDASQCGKLNKEQFALAMWLIQQKLAGHEPPQVLAPNMIPPSQRPESKEATEPAAPAYSNPELDMITRDIEELAKERRSLERDIAQKETDIKVRTGEVKSLQSELDTLVATFKQLEFQKGEAQKRLNDLKTQRTAVDAEMEEVEAELRIEEEKVDKLRTQADAQEESLKTQEGELNSKKQELQGLKDEETRMQTQQTQAQTQLQDLTKQLQDMQLQISQTKAQVTQLEECQRQIKDAVTLCEAALASGDALSLSQSSLEITPSFREVAPIVNGRSPTAKQQEGFSKANDPFSNKSHVNSNGSAFGTPDPFQEDTSDPFKGTNGFDDDPFSKQDAFGNDPFPATSVKADPFTSDPFGDKVASKSPSDGSQKDPFGCDPFAALHAPVRPVSPSPALPPKKSKQPPPRPAPPKQGPARPPPPQHSPQPPSSTGATNFADFADFDSKQSKAMTAPVPRYADFTDDPFRDYRYEDPFNIADPFADDASSTPDTDSFRSPVSVVPSSAGSKSTSSLDFFPSDSDKFDTFSNSTPIRTDATSAPIKTDTKSLEFDSFITRNNTFDAFSTKNDKFDAFKPNKNSTLDNFTQKSDSKSVDAFGLDTFDSNFNFPSTNTKRSGRFSVPLSGKSSIFKKSSKVTSPYSEAKQMAWAAAESLQVEEDRKRREKQEQEDYELALVISRAQATHDKL